MKRASLIVEHIKNLPQFKLMKKFSCFKKFVSSLNPRLQKAIEFSYTKDDTLFIAISHPGYKMELYSKIDFLKSVLSKVKDFNEDCKSIKASRIVIINARLKSVRESFTLDTAIYYEERALEGFEIDISDEDLKEVFERIRDNIISGTERA